MNPLVVLSALFASALAAPAAQHVAIAGAPVVAAHAAPIAAAHPVAYAHAPLAIEAPLPAPHVTQAKEADVTTIHKPAPIVTKQVHLGQTSYISGYATNILKPAIPDFKIAVPTALKGTVATNPAAVTVQKEIHTVNQPVPVEKPYNVPYDVIKHVEKVVEVPTPVHGEPIIQKVQGAPVVRHHHTNVVAQPHLAYAHAPVAAYAHHAAPAVAVAHH